MAAGQTIRLSGTASIWQITARRRMPRSFYCADSDRRRREDTSSSGENTPKTVDITSVNGGKDFIYDEDAVQRYGWIFPSAQMGGCHTAGKPHQKARAYLEQSIYLSDVLKPTAVDLANVDVDIKRLKTGYWTKVISRPHGVDVMYISKNVRENLQEPGKDTVSLGGTIATLSGSMAKSQKELSAKVEQVGQAATKGIDQKINNATQLISGGLGGYVVMDAQRTVSQRKF